MNVLEGREAYLSTIAQLASERAAAKPLIESIRTSGKDLWEIDIPAEWRNAGFVQELTAEAAAILENDPRNSLSLAQLALAIATNIPGKAYPAPILAQLEGNAWKEIGTAHRYLGEFDASLRAYDAAKRAYGAANVYAHDDAIIDFGRAVVLVDLNRCAEAIDILKRVEPAFESFADKERLRKVKMLRAYVCTRQYRWEEARAFFESALIGLPDDDLYTRSMLYGNIGAVCTELGDFNNAVLMLHQSRQLKQDLGMPVEVNRCDWNLAKVLLQTGEFAKAVPMLRQSREFFLEKQMSEDAGLAGLDLADATIALGRLDEARILVSAVLSEFTNARQNDRALSALAYLRDVLPTISQPNKAVRHVRQYIDRLQSEPALLFLPLPE
jgi:tetratricopeptide (TPR) repeat protein